MEMTEFLIFWIGTIITSFSMKIMYELRMYKDLADAGYKFNSQKLSKLEKELNPKATKNTLLSMLIPMFNIMQVLQTTIQYNNTKSTVLNQFNIMGVLEEMNAKEKEDYQEKPTGINAFIVPIKFKIRLSEATVEKIVYENEVCEIYYEPGESIQDMTILKVTGPLSRFSEEEQKQKIIAYCKNTAQITAQIFKEEVKKELTSNKSNDLNISINKTAEDILEKLKQEKDFFIKEQHNQTLEYEDTKGAYGKKYKQ